MRMRRIPIITIITVVVIVTAAVVTVTGADLPQASLTPDRILKGTTPTITITLDRSIPNQGQISSVRVGGYSVAVKTREKELSVQLPKLNIVGQIDVDVIDKHDNLMAVGKLNYFEPAEQSSKEHCFLFIYVILIVLLPLICTIYDIYQSYKERDTVLGKLPSNATINEIKTLLVDMDQGPSGLVGLTRGIVAISLILILGIAAFHLVVFTPAVPHIAEQLLTLLAGTLTAITGFYFGTKATTPTPASFSKLDDVKISDSGTPKISNVSGADKKKFKVIGERFGEKKGAVKLRDKGKGNDIPVSVSKWEDKHIEVDLSTELEPGTTLGIIVTNDNGKASDEFQYSITK